MTNKSRPEERKEWREGLSVPENLQILGETTDK
jgi:hypothetical protein